MTKLSELQKNYRNEVFETLELLSSIEEQLDYQRKVPYISVSNELFNAWEACYQDVFERDWYKNAFSEKELRLLSRFDDTFEEICKNTPRELPELEKFIGTEMWNKLSISAQEILFELRAT